MANPYTHTHMHALYFILIFIPEVVGYYSANIHVLPTFLISPTSKWGGYSSVPLTFILAMNHFDQWNVDGMMKAETWNVPALLGMPSCLLPLPWERYALASLLVPSEYGSHMRENWGKYRLANTIRSIDWDISDSFCKLFEIWWLIAGSKR